MSQSKNAFFEDLPVDALHVIRKHLSFSSAANFSAVNKHNNQELKMINPIECRQSIHQRVMLKETDSFATFDCGDSDICVNCTQHRLEQFAFIGIALQSESHRKSQKIHKLDKVRHTRRRRSYFESNEKLVIRFTDYPFDTAHCEDDEPFIFDNHNVNPQSCVDMMVYPDEFHICPRTTSKYSKIHSPISANVFSIIKNMVPAGIVVQETIEHGTDDMILKFTNTSGGQVDRDLYLLLVSSVIQGYAKRVFFGELLDWHIPFAKLQIMFSKLLTALPADVDIETPWKFIKDPKQLEEVEEFLSPVSYTHLTLPTKRIV